MDIESIQREVTKAAEASFARKTDKQLLSYEILAELYKGKNKGVQPAAFAKYNEHQNRRCKLTIEQVKVNQT